MTSIGSLVWLSKLPDVGPLPALVLSRKLDTIHVVVFSESVAAEPLKSITPWTVEDGTEWGWSEIPADGVVPADHFA